MLKPEPERRGLPTSSEGPGRCYCIRKACLIVIIALGNVLTSNNVENVSFSLVSRITRRRFDNAAYMAYTNVTLTSQNNVATVRVLCDDIKLCDSPGILHAKSRIHVLTQHELPC